ncbi:MULTISPECIES: hypothetical protein [unclassified Colwellia]|jgi:hypothetical protein|uniref:hypothetical protein n=1 Tax=unclassified Colwellia TaxID=196834 RepID=UPI0015F4AE2C|nr:MULTISPECIES: hypothetical protein [unclassified Colwellia]MBA6364565.1 hypothetical protein [Colwellia sp. BRX8-8]MBA6338900.1 hypothetical protein [Colwellia sp. BRX8-7]MBA6348756.1 hypothetical protein [Colwellia sp. BRX8-9]MBA6371348.1 hypothetical protein [Colwellia sp. BRX8-4]MBA6380149.1 hypothetical protein [Colwellia sp. BRX10-7]|tara:strand:+ start:615 stop:911 length:297 start_codon:yes stop_codon:yes gene_type:complete
MFKYWSIKSYGTKLLPTLERDFGCKEYYTAAEIRITIFKNNFSPTYLPLGYILFLDEISLKETMYIEFPHIDVNEYRQEISNYLISKSYHGYLQVLHH